MTTPPAAPAVAVATINSSRPFAALELPEDEKFNGKNYPAFIRNMRVLVRYLKVLYLIDDKSQKKPDKAVEEDDEELLYLCMHRNLDENGKELIAEHSGDGVAAWTAFSKRFGRADTGTTMDKFWEHITTRWEGGDGESFIEFVAKWDSTRRELRNRGIVLEDWIDALILMAMVPREFTTKLKDSELQDWKQLKREDVIDRIQAYIGAQGKEGAVAHYARQQPPVEKNKSNNDSYTKNSNKNNNKGKEDRPPLKPCSICKDKLKLPEDKCKHPEDRCFNKDRFATLLKGMQDNNNNQSNDRAFAAVELSEAEEIETCYMGIQSIHAADALVAREHSDI